MGFDSTDKNTASLKIVDSSLNMESKLIFLSIIMNELQSDARGIEEKILIGQDYFLISKSSQKLGIRVDNPNPEFVF